MGPEKLGGHVLLFLEYPVEIGQVVEPAFKTDLGYGFVGIHEHPGSITQSDIYDIVRKGFSGTQFENG